MAGEYLTSHILGILCVRHTLELWSTRHAFMDDSDTQENYKIFFQGSLFSFEVFQVLTRPPLSTVREIDQTNPAPKIRKTPTN